MPHPTPFANRQAFLDAGMGDVHHRGGEHANNSGAWSYGFGEIEKGAAQYGEPWLLKYYSLGGTENGRSPWGVFYGNGVRAPHRRPAVPMGCKGVRGRVIVLIETEVD